MKKNVLLISAVALLSHGLLAQTKQQKDSIKTIGLKEIIVSTTRAGDKTPVAYSNLNKEEIETRNIGQDLPYLLNFTPSLVATSDAGAGVGYTGMRIRGSDASRVNITINGIPFNDPESQGSFLVNVPDLSSSVNSIQIQRGVGTSTNGSGAFGASVNLETSAPSQDAFAEINNSFGSFGTRKHNVILNSGLINDKWSFEGRLSKIASDGYVDRSASNLKSYYLSGSYLANKTTIKALVFGGKEITHQAWYGTPEAILNNDADGIEAVIANNGVTEEQANNMRNDGRTFNWYTYENEVDDYTQDHYQLHLNQEISDKWSLNLSGHYTYGRGYFEQFKNDDNFSDYGLDNITVGSETIESSDIIRRRWLDNDFYGFTYGLNFNTSKLSTILGGGYHYFSGDHFGEIIWAQYAANMSLGDRYYDNVGVKKDFNTFLKANYQINDKFNLFGDLQLRKVNYHTVGIDSDQRVIATGDNYSFFNPKFGLTYQLSDNANLYASYAISNREPERNDFIDNSELPKHESMRDLEVGYKRNTKNYAVELNFYNMSYDNQLVLTGALNDVGSNVRTNVAKSYRRGIELNGGIKLSQQFDWNANVTFSQNKIENFTEVLYDYGAAWDEYNVVENGYKDSDIAFSPNVIAGSNFSYSPIEAFKISLLSKYVGKQYLDNTSNDDRTIDAYFVNNLQFTFNFKTKLIKDIGLNLLVNNLLDYEYESNGYTFGYSAGSDYVVRENYLYPQAGRNFLLALKLRF
ncbi:TonB-dependent receptor [Reichenbachiella sp. MALMAid0571]|uniref:TonB-dependent receptor n=1 Tax=Reichenbachiella sp. MALMAid0571 TaxID=3143939 RepID=UPI0032E037C1